MKGKLGIILVSLAVVAGGYFAFFRGTDGGKEIEYRYAPVEVGELLRSTSATGTLVPLTKVDIKSKAGGKIVRLAVEEGTEVRTGDLVAEIDPEDTRSVFEQAAADVRAAEARVQTARTSASLESLSTATAVRDAEIRVKLAEIALARAREENTSQPVLTEAEIRTAEAGLNAAQESLRQLRDVTIPQRRNEAQSNLSRTEVDLAAAKSELERQERLYEKGYVALSAVERARTAHQSALAAFQVASERIRTLDTAFSSELRAEEARVKQAEANVRQAKANSNRIVLAQQSLREAQRSLDQAKLNLKRSQDERLNVRLREIDIQSAQANAVRSSVTMKNAQVQLDSTRVTAPRDGVVTLKYLEEGTIIPPGTSTFAQGTSIVQISDVTQMFVECSVDETDISTVRVDQPVRVVVEAYPGRTFSGVVRKIFPAAETANSITTIKVRIEITDLAKAREAKTPLRPGMNATCEFILLQKENVIVVPSQAVKREGEESYVLLKTADPKKPERRVVKLGENGNEGVEILEGLKEGDEIVIAEIDIASLRERQERMEQMEQGGGLGSQRSGGPSQSRAGAGNAGGARR